MGSAQTDSTRPIPFQIHGHESESQLFEPCTDSCAPLSFHELEHLILRDFNPGDLTMVTDSKVPESLAMENGFCFFDPAQFFSGDGDPAWDSR